MSSKNPVAGAQFSITRVLDAPRDLVWKVLTESSHLMHWWGPKGLTMRTSELDLRPGGTFHYSMTSPGGNIMWGKWVFREIVPPEKLVYISSFSDEAGSTTKPPFSDDWPAEILNTTTLTEENGKTTLTITGYPINATEAQQQTFDSNHKSMQQGFTGTLDQLDEYLKTL